jgi:hypothetical protein
MATLIDRQINNIVKKLNHHDKVYVHDKRLLPHLNRRGLKVVKVLSEKGYCKGSWYHYCGSAGPVTACMLLHWVKSGRLNKDEICKHYPSAVKVFNEPNIENAKQLLIKINTYDGYGMNIFGTTPLVHKSEFYVVRTDT